MFGYVEQKRKMKGRRGRGRRKGGKKEDPVTTGNQASSKEKKIEAKMRHKNLYLNRKVFRGNLS